MKETTTEMVAIIRQPMMMNYRRSRKKPSSFLLLLRRFGDWPLLQRVERPIQLSLTWIHVGGATKVRWRNTKRNQSIWQVSGKSEEELSIERKRQKRRASFPSAEMLAPLPGAYCGQNCAT